MLLWLSVTEVKGPSASNFTQRGLNSRQGINVRFSAKPQYDAQRFNIVPSKKNSLCYSFLEGGEWKKSIHVVGFLLLHCFLNL